MNNLKFEDKRGRTVTVIKTEGNIAILNNGDRVAIERLNDSRFYTTLMSNSVTGINENQNQNMSIPNGEIIVKNAEQSRYESLAKNSSYAIGETGQAPSHMRDTGYGGQSHVKMSGSVVESHNDNLKKLGKDPMPEPVHKPKPVYNNYENNSSLTDEEKLLRKYGHQAPNPVTDDKLKDIVYGEPKVTESEIISNYPTSNTPVQETINPVHQMFEKAKKVFSLNVNLKLKEKIPNKDVIKMMEDNFDESAIDYYAKDIYKKLMENPSVIEEQVKEAIKKYLNKRTPSTAKKKKD